MTQDEEDREREIGNRLAGVLEEFFLNDGDLGQLAENINRWLEYWDSNVPENPSSTFRAFMLDGLTF